MSINDKRQGQIRAAAEEAVERGERSFDVSPTDMLEILNMLEGYRADSFTGQMEHGYWQGRAEEAEAAAEAAEEKGRVEAVRQITDLLGTVTRVTVVHGSRGRDYEEWDFNGIGLYFQDDGKTLKVIDMKGDLS